MFLLNKFKSKSFYRNDRFICYISPIYFPLTFITYTDPTLTPLYFNYNDNSMNFSFKLLMYPYVMNSLHIYVPIPTST